MNAAEWQRNHRRKIPVMVNGKSFDITFNELLKINDILLKINAEDLENMLKINGGMLKINIENGEICEKTPFLGENAPRGGRGGLFLLNNTSNPSGTSDSTIVQKEKNKIKKEKTRENHSEEFIRNFETFWQAYPKCKRKTDKRDALKKFAAAFREDKSLTFEKIMKGLEFWKNDSGWLKFPLEDFIPAPEVWLHKCRWAAAESEPAKPSEPSRACTAPSQPLPQPSAEEREASRQSLLRAFKPAAEAV